MCFSGLAPVLLSLDFAERKLALTDLDRGASLQIPCATGRQGRFWWAEHENRRIEPVEFKARSDTCRMCVALCRCQTLLPETRIHSLLEAPPMQQLTPVLPEERTNVPPCGRGIWAIHPSSSCDRKRYIRYRGAREQEIERRSRAADVSGNERAVPELAPPAGAVIPIRHQ